MSELQMYINCFMPFGTPSDTSVPNVKSVKRFGFPSGIQALTDMKVRASGGEDAISDPHQVTQINSDRRGNHFYTKESRSLSL